MTRISTLAQYDRSMSLIQDAQARTFELQTRIGSGRKSQDYAGVARDTQRLVSLEAAHVRVSQYTENNKLVELRLQSMEGSVGQIFDIASKFKALLVQSLNSGAALDLNLNGQALQMLQQTASLLNAREDGRYLFAGNRTDTEPVDMSTLPVSYTIPTTDGDSSAYYQGDAHKHVIRADDNFDVSYGVTADEQGFERLIRSLDMVVKGAPTDTAMLNHALSVVDQAIANIPTIRTAIGLDRTTLTQTNQKHSDFLLFTEQSISSIENVDLALAATQLSEAQLTLDASYLTLTRLSQTTLLNYLR